MNSRNTMISFYILSLACLGNQNALAGTVYQWTDEAGNANFSDVPPDESVITTTHEISINQHDPDNVDFEKYSIFNQLERMTEWRRQIAEERLEKKKLILEEKRLAYEMELNRQNEAIAAEEYAPRTYYYAPYRFRRHHSHGIDTRPHTSRQRHINKPSHRNIISRKHVSGLPHRNIISRKRVSGLRHRNIISRKHGLARL